MRHEENEPIYVRCSKLLREGFLLGQRSSCRRKSFNAASARGLLLLSCLMSQSACGDSPISEPISTSERPVFSSALMRDFQVTITPSLRYPVQGTQRDHVFGVVPGRRASVIEHHRHPVTAFRDTASMPFLGENIKKARERLGLTKKELAARAGISPGMLGDLESGRQKGTTKIHRLAQALGTTAHDLERGVMPEVPPSGSVAMAALSEREEELLRLFRAAPPSVKRAIEGAAGKPQEPPEFPREPARPTRRS